MAGPILESRGVSKIAANIQDRFVTIGIVETIVAKFLF